MKTHLVLFAVLLLASGCGYHPHDAALHTEHDAALEAARANTIEPGSATEAAAIQAFKDVFADFDVDILRGGITALYAEDAYFRDAFVELRGDQRIEDYFVASTEPVSACTFEIVDVAENDGNYYFRWIMTLSLNRYPDRPANVSHGLTHVRFNRDGEVSFHQDYWDSVALYNEFPIIGPLLRTIRGMIE